MFFLSPNQQCQNTAEQLLNTVCRCPVVFLSLNCYLRLLFWNFSVDFSAAYASGTIGKWDVLFATAHAACSRNRRRYTWSICIVITGGIITPCGVQIIIIFTYIYSGPQCSYTLTAVGHSAKAESMAWCIERAFSPLIKRRLKCCSIVCTVAGWPDIEVKIFHAHSCLDTIL